MKSRIRALIYGLVGKLLGTRPLEKNEEALLRVIKALQNLNQRLEVLEKQVFGNPYPGTEELYAHNPTVTLDLENRWDVEKLLENIENLCKELEESAESIGSRKIGEIPITLAEAATLERKLAETLEKCGYKVLVMVDSIPSTNSLGNDGDDEEYIERLPTNSVLLRKNSKCIIVAYTDVKIDEKPPYRLKVAINVFWAPCEVLTQFFTPP